jgi:hypothetical protein
MNTCVYCQSPALYHAAKAGTLDISSHACAKHLTRAVDNLLAQGEIGVQIFPAQPVARAGGAAEIRKQVLRLVDAG